MLNKDKPIVSGAVQSAPASKLMIWGIRADKRSKTIGRIGAVIVSSLSIATFIMLWIFSNQLWRF